jgi:hypothetical protein
MNKEFVPYDIALAMNELGFDNVSCLGVYYGEFSDDDKSWGLSEIDEENENHFISSTRSTQYEAQKGYHNGILAPLYQQAFRWFREKGYNVSIDSHTVDGKGNYKDFFFTISKDGVYLYRVDHRDGFGTYEEAEYRCLIQLIELVKK